MQAVILAGGKGKRLLPYTTVLPKPLMPIGDYPILEVVIRQLEHAGFSDIIISTGYLDALIRAYVEGRNVPSQQIRFSHETTPLGTIGPLHLIQDLDDVFLVINGDILTDIPFRDLFSYHKKHDPMATIASYSRQVKTDFGIIEYDNENRVTAFTEKPVLSYHVSMGIYILHRKILTLVPKDEPFGFDDLMRMMVARQWKVMSYPYNGYWLDIGRPDDYAEALSQCEKNPGLFIRPE